MILVVDDSPSIRRLVTLILERKGYRVASASSVEEATHWIHSQGIPSLILLDIHLPGCDGIQACRDWRTEPALRDVPVVIFSGGNEILDREAAFAAGATAHLAKPFTPEKLYEAVASQLEAALMPRQ
jgi:CheY-like chemotaxis protein